MRKHFLKTAYNSTVNDLYTQLIGKGWLDQGQLGQNSVILFSPDHTAVTRIAIEPDFGFEAFTDFCKNMDSIHLPELYESFHTSDDCHISVFKRYKRYPHEHNETAQRQIKSIHSLLWDDPPRAAIPVTLIKVLHSALKKAQQLNKCNTNIYSGLDIADPDTENFLFSEENGQTNIVLHDIFARRGLPQPPQWHRFQRRLQKLAKQSDMVLEP